MFTTGTPCRLPYVEQYSDLTSHPPMVGGIAIHRLATHNVPRVLLRRTLHVSSVQTFTTKHYRALIREVRYKPTFGKSTRYGKYFHTPLAQGDSVENVI